MERPDGIFQAAIHDAISAWRPGYVFTPKDLLAVAKRGMVDVTLNTLTKQGKIRRIARGLYDIPKKSPTLGIEMSPDIDEIAKSFSRRFSWHLVPSGAHAANLLGLTSQVPAKAVYLSDGPTKKLRIGNRELLFQRTRPRDMARDAEPEIALFIQAVKHLGREAAMKDETIAMLREKLSPTMRKRLREETRYVTDWIYDLAKQLAREENE